MEWTPHKPRHRWPYELGVLVLLVVVLLGVAGGAARSTADSAGRAAELRGRGDFGAAAALYTQIAGRNGPIYLFARGIVSTAEREEQKTLLAWATALAGQGRLDQALALVAGVTDPGFARAAGDERATLLIAAARQAASAGDYATALLRLDQLLQAAPSGALASQADGLRTPFVIGQARTLIAAGHGSDALVMLDSTGTVSGPDRAAFAAVLPAALLAAGREEIADLSFQEAAATLQRLVDAFHATREARTAAALISHREPVGGTLTFRGGGAISGQIRLSSNFQSTAGGYATSGPFYYSSADGDGDFVVASVPLGGPYVLEVFHSGNWTTLIDPSTGRPANPVTVSALQPVDLTFIVLPQ